MYEARQAVVDQAKLEEEMGDLLFATVNLARHLGTKAEIALQKANENLSVVSRSGAYCCRAWTGNDRC